MKLRAPTDAVAFYSDVATEFHESYKSDANRQERLRIWRGLLDQYAQDAKVAYDIGCGSGILACELAQRGVSTTGIDGAPAMIDLARQSAHISGLGNVRFQQHRLPISDVSAFSPADIVISSSAIEYLDSIHDALVFLRALLKPGAVTIFSVSNRHSWSRAAVRFVHWLTGYPVYLGLLKHFLTIEETKTALNRAGLVYVEHMFFARSDRINRILATFLPARMSSNMIIVVARRA